MSKKLQIAVLGAGNMGTALAHILAQNGHYVRLWDYNPETVRAIARDKQNKKFLPNIKLSSRIAPEADMKKAVAGADLVFIAVSSPYVRKIASLIRDKSQSAIVVQVAKGLEEKTFFTMHEVVQSELPAALRRKVVTISGPSIANEFAAGVHTAIVVAGQDKEAMKLAQNVLESPTFKVALSNDVKGVGICGALKNVYAIALGMCDGMKLSFNAKSFMFSAALAEMASIVQKLGGKRETVFGLAGAGDLVATGLGQSRNRSIGERICKQGHCQFVHIKNAQTYEGVDAAKTFYTLVHRKKISAPLVSMVYRVLYRNADPCQEIQKFFRTANFVSE